MSVRFVDELDGVLGWTETTGMRRTSHALVDAGRVWVIDPFDAEGVEERLRGLGEPAGVVQLLDRHNRDSAELAERLGVPLHVVPEAVAGSPFWFVPVVRLRFWREVGLPDEDVEAVLVGDRHLDLVQGSTRQAVSIGASAVPAFLLDRRLLVLGAQPEELFERAVAQLSSEEGEGGP